MEASQVISLLKARDEQGLSYLYDNYSGALNGVIFRIVGSEKVSEEILQQTFLKIWDKINTYDPSKSTLFTWMSRIARNSAIDVKRLKSYENNQKNENIEDQYDIAGKSPDVSDKMDVEILLKDLDPKFKEVLDCVYLQGYSHREAAERLNLPIGTVKTRVRNALMQIRKNIESENGLLLSGSIILLLISLALCF